MKKWLSFLMCGLLCALLFGGLSGGYAQAQDNEGRQISDYRLALASGFKASLGLPF
jgi:hypothetical protein